MTDKLPCLPALKSLGDLATVRPCIVIDTREQTPLVFHHLRSVRGTLQTGDYSFAGGQELFAVERKSIADLVACCTGDNRDRFERELHRLRGFRFKRLLVTGHEVEIKAARYRSGISPKAVLHSLAAFEIRYDCPLVWAGNAEAAALLVERWVWWFTRELVLNANELWRNGGEDNAAAIQQAPGANETKAPCVNLHR